MSQPSLCPVCGEREVRSHRPRFGGVCGSCWLSRCKRVFLKAMTHETAFSLGSVIGIIHGDLSDSLALYAEVLEYLGRYCMEPQTWIYILAEGEPCATPLAEADTLPSEVSERRQIQNAMSPEAEELESIYLQVLSAYLTHRNGSDRGERHWKVRNNPLGREDVPQVLMFPRPAGEPASYFPSLRRTMEHSLRGDFGVRFSLILDASNSDIIAERVLKSCLLGNLDVGTRCAAQSIVLCGDNWMIVRESDLSAKRASQSAPTSAHQSVPLVSEETSGPIASIPPSDSVTVLRPFRSLRKTDVSFMLRSFTEGYKIIGFPEDALSPEVSKLLAASMTPFPGSSDDVLTAEIRKIDYSPESVLTACTRISFEGSGACPICGSVLQREKADNGSELEECPCRSI